MTPIASWSIAIFAVSALTVSAFFVVQNIRAPRRIEVGVPAAAVVTRSVEIQEQPKVLKNDEHSRVQVDDAQNDTQIPETEVSLPDHVQSTNQVESAEGAPDSNNPNIACVAGISQSPINIERPAITRELRPLIFAYGQISPTVMGRGSNRKIEIGKEKLRLRFQSIDYRVESMSVKFPSEHMIDGEQYAAEIQIRHKSQSSKEQLVLAVLVRGGSASEWSEHFAQAVQNQESFDLNGLIPEDKAYYEYPGSLTEPPCNEGVTWIVLKKPQFAADDVLRLLKDDLGGEARPLQAVHERRTRMSSR